MRILVDDQSPLSSARKRAEVSLLPQPQNSRESDRRKQLHKSQARKQLRNKELITASEESISLLKRTLPAGNKDQINNSKKIWTFLLF